MVVAPVVTGFNRAKIRAPAAAFAAEAPLDDVSAAAFALRTADDTAQRQLAVYLLGVTTGRQPGHLAALRKQAADPSWEVQEALVQAFDTYCATVGYEAALPTIDAWLADMHPNRRRAVSEGLRPWTSKKRRYFADHPGAAIRRLAALRADPSEYVRRSAGDALRDIRRKWPLLVDAETATWDLNDRLQLFTYRHVLSAR